MSGFPPAARTACWLNAWIAGRKPSDDVVDGLVGDHRSVWFFPVSGSEAIPPALVLGMVRKCSVRQVSLCLPRPGLPLGLGGPSAFNADALEAREAMLWHGAGVGYVPQRVGSTLNWTGSTAALPAYLPDVATADRDLRALLASATERLADLDIASWSPDVADELMNVRSPRSVGPPLPFASVQAARLASTATRCRTIVELARNDDGGALSASEMAARREVLTELDDAARVALVAACSAIG